MPLFRFHSFLPERERAIGELLSPNPLQVAQSATVLLRAAAPTSFLQPSCRRSGEEGRKEGRKEGGFAMDADGRGRTHAGEGGWRLGGQPGCSFALSFPSLARSLTSHDDAVSLPLPASFLPYFLRFLSRGRLARPESVDDDDDDEHTSSPARTLAREWPNCKVFSRENCATHAKAKKRPSVARSPRQVIRPRRPRACLF